MKLIKKSRFKNALAVCASSKAGLCQPVELKPVDSDVRVLFYKTQQEQLLFIKKKEGNRKLPPITEKILTKCYIKQFVLFSQRAKYLPPFKGIDVDLFDFFHQRIRRICACTLIIKRLFD